MDSGLAGLIAAETVLSHSDGARGILWVRGHTLPELVADFGYEGAVGLLWEGFAGNGLEREEMRARLGAGRTAAFARRGEWLDQAKTRPFIEGVRLALAALPETATPAEILATLPVAIAALVREGKGEAPLAPDPARGTADDLLRMAHGAPVPPAIAEALDAYFTAVIARLKPGRPPLQPNIEINAALLLDAVGLPREAFTPVFAVARCAGWLAHAMEQQKEGRLVRPSSAYIGPVPAGAKNPG